MIIVKLFKAIREIDSELLETSAPHKSTYPQAEADSEIFGFGSVSRSIPTKIVHLSSIVFNPKSDFGIFRQ